MGFRLKNMKERLLAISRSSDAQVWTPKKFYRNQSIKSILLKYFFIPILTIGGLGYFTIDKKESPYIKFPKAKLEVISKFEKPIIQAQFANFVEPKKQTPKLVTLNIKDKNKKSVIRADVLEKAGTTILGKTFLRYTKKGIRTPGPDYGVLVEGVDYFPNSEGFIVLPKEILNKRVRLTKINLNKLGMGTEKYLASYLTRIQVEKPESEINKKYVAEGEKDVFKKKNLERDTQEKGINKKIGLENKCNFEITNPKFASLDNMDIEPKLKEYQERNFKAKNKEYMRSNYSLVKEMTYEGDTSFNERIIGLKTKYYSNKKIAKIMRKETKKYFSEEKGININSKQISDTLTKENWISKRKYKKDPEKYDTLDTKYILYDKNSILTIFPKK
ncbi:MAG: hypothetical protein KKF48_03160 [Nanoarchaeota archaeon]|nr:hypothetical protein [Nanoarchaeota archaeon]MBU1028022.1 hypothetical protein [Nanoarchaeota archaeon]